MFPCSNWKRVALLWTLLLLWPVVGVAQASDDAKASAERVNKLAIAAYQRGDYQDAAAQWAAAEQLHPTWKYALNLAGTLTRLERYPEGWAALERAESRETPEKHRAQIDKMRATIETKLYPTHARLALHLEPKDARATLDGKAWDRAWSRWVARKQSTLVVSKPGYSTHRQTWRHPFGRAHSISITLTRVAQTGKLIVRGEPAGAVVKVGGARVGILPLRNPLPLKAGRYTVIVERDGYIPFHGKVIITAGKTADLNAVLQKLEAPVTIQKRSNALAIAGWSTAGVGLAMAASGIAVLAWAEEALADAEALNGDPTRAGTNFTDDYLAEWGRIEASYDDRRVAGFVLVGVGAAAAIAGVALVSWHYASAPEGRTEGTTTNVTPFLLPGGGGLKGTVRF